MTENLDEEIEDELGDASEEIIPFKYSITSYFAVKKSALLFSRSSL